MGRYLLRRTLLAFPAFLGVITLVFLVLRVLPGDPALVIVAGSGPYTTTEQIEALRARLGLDRPLLLQYGEWLAQAVRFDFGESLRTGQPILRELGQRYPATLTLLVLALLVALTIALPVGILSALRRDTWIDYTLRLFTLAGFSLPSFFIAILLLLASLYLFRWAPPVEYRPLWEDPGLHFQRLLLPALAVGYRFSAITARMVRSCLLEVLGQEYVRTARAKGLSEGVVVVRHALRNAFLPVLTLVGMEVVALLGGIVIVETVFTVPGIGRFLVDAVLYRDYPSVQALVFLFALAVVAVNLAVDLAYGWLDPRVRYG